MDIAIYDSDTSHLNFKCKSCRDAIWMNRQTPIARRILKVSLVRIPKVLYYCVAFVSVLGIGICFMFLVFNLHFRRMKTVKLSSPKLNNVAVFGCILVYLSVILLGIDTSVTTRRYFNGLCSVSKKLDGFVS